MLALSNVGDDGNDEDAPSASLCLAFDVVAAASEPLRTIVKGGRREEESCVLLLHLHASLRCPACRWHVARCVAGACVNVEGVRVNWESIRVQVEGIRVRVEDARVSIVGSVRTRVWGVEIRDHQGK